MVDSPRAGFEQVGPQAIPLEYADLTEWIRIIASWLSQVSPQIFQIIDHKGDFGILINATYDDQIANQTTAFSRLDTTRIAWWIDVRSKNVIPGEEEIGGAKGICFWRARADASQPLNGYSNADGWELRAVVTENGNIVVQSGMEMDGNGFLPYGRVTHYTDNVTTPTVELTGLLKNLFLDFSGADVSGDPSWFAGFDGLNDRFVLRRWVAGTVGAGNGTDLLQVDSDGSVQVVGPLGLVSYAKTSLPAAGSHNASLVYVTDEAGGAVPAFSDGTNWRRVTDRAVVS